MFNTIIVDDVKFTRDEIKALDIWGEMSGFIISAEASNGRDAMQIIQRQMIDLIITDIKMPFIDGITLAQRALNDKMCKCVILMSQFSDFEFARKGIQYGVSEYLLKPIRKEDLLISLHRVEHLLNERTRQLVRLNVVGQMKNQDYYSYDLIKHLVKSIKDNDENSEKIATEIYNNIWRGMKSDKLKLTEYLGRVLRDFSNEVIFSFPWINKMSLAYSAIAFSNKCYDEIRELFLNHIRQTKELINNYELTCTDNSIIKTVCRYVLDNVDEPISLKVMSKRLFISNTYLSNLFRIKTGIKLNDYVTTVKLERSKILLEEGVLKNYEIANQIGYNIEYFSKLFKKTYQLSPTQYKNNLSK